MFVSKEGDRRLRVACPSSLSSLFRSSSSEMRALDSAKSACICCIMRCMLSSNASLFIVGEVTVGCEVGGPWVVCGGVLNAAYVVRGVIGGSMRTGEAEKGDVFSTVAVSSR